MKDPEQPMRVVADITRWDLFLASLRIILRYRWMWAVCGIGFVSSLWSQWHSEYRPTHWFHVVYFLAVFGAFWFGVLLALALIMAIGTILQVSTAPGVLGRHTFEIRSDGLFESTSANQTVTNWSAIPRAIRTDRYIFVYLTWWLFQLIPRRAFPDSEAYDAFFDALQERIGRGA